MSQNEEARSNSVQAEEASSGEKKVKVGKAKEKVLAMSRDETLRRAAKMKAAIISLLNGTDKPLTKSEISLALADLIEELNYKASNIDNFLYTMAKNGLIGDIGENPNGLGHLYVSLNNPLAQEFADKESFGTTRKSGSSLRTTKRKRSESEVSDVTVDIVKSTGRIRVSIKGFSIEIGIVE